MTDSQQRPRPNRIVAVERRDQHLIPAYREAFSRFGLELRVVADLEEWMGAQSAPLLVLRVAETEDWGRLEQLARARGATVVALLSRNVPSFYRRALLTGASGIAAATDAPVHVARVLQAALADYALVPLTALRETNGNASKPVLSASNTALLRGLAQGKTADQLAAEQGCSERTIYRRIRRVCTSLQVRSRDEAVAMAQRLGLLTPTPH